MEANSESPPVRLLDAINAGTRIAILAPHPDDESLGTGGLIQIATARGAQVHVVFVTDGDNNPWPQRFVERRWFIGAPERARWGARRRLEGQKALALLSQGQGTSESLGLPDAGILAFWEAKMPGPKPAIEKLFREWQPQIVVVPSEIDRHPDHQATHEYGLDAIRQIGLHCLVYSYCIHRPWSQKMLRRHVASDALTLSSHEQSQKLAAIQCHETQMALSAGRFSKFASPLERYTLVQIS